MAEPTLPRTAFLVLVALQHGGRHGYDIAAFIDDKSGGFFKPSFGALYPVLHKLEQEGLVRGAWMDGGARRKKVYSLTRTGKKALAVERERTVAEAGALARLVEG